MFSDTERIKQQPRQTPLTYTQRNFWFIQQLVPDSPVFIMFRAWRISGDLNVAALKQVTAGVYAKENS